MKRHEIEFLWAWFDALRRRDANDGPEEVVAGFVAGYDADQEIDSLELLGGERHIVLGVRGPDLGQTGDVEIGSEMYNVFTIENEKITRIEDYLRRDEALAAADLT